MSKLDPFRDLGKVRHNDLPMIKGQKILLSDPLLLERLKHVAKPYGGGHTLSYDTVADNDKVPVYVDLEMFARIMLNEVLHLRQQIGLVCEGAYKSTQGQFRVFPEAPHTTPNGRKEDDSPVYIEDFVAERTR
jgi:hypothetical protein